MIDWLLGGATPTQPVNKYVGLSLGTPTSIEGKLSVRSEHRLRLHPPNLINGRS